MQIVGIIKRGAVGLHDLVMPRACAACGSAMSADESGLCVDCTLNLSECISGDYCKSCGRSRGPHILKSGICTSCELKESPLRFDGFARVGKYDGALRTLILRFKHHFELDRALGQLLRLGIENSFGNPGIDVWCAIPSHWWRRMKLGYQPTALLIREAQRGLSGRVLPALGCCKYVAPFHQRQSASSAERAEAIKGAFVVREPTWVKGRNICLVDDVMTSGATLSEAKRMLRKAGAKRIYAAVLACAGDG